MESREPVIASKIYDIIKANSVIWAKVNSLKILFNEQNKQLLDEITKLKRDNIALESVSKQLTEHIDIKNNEINDLKSKLILSEEKVKLNYNCIIELQSELKDCTENYNHYVDKCFKLKSELKAADSVNEQLTENQIPEYLIEFVDDVKHMIKLYNNSSHTRSEEYRDKLAEKLDDIRTIDLKP